MLKLEQSIFFLRYDFNYNLIRINMHMVYTLKGEGFKGELR